MNAKVTMSEGHGEAVLRLNRHVFAAIAVMTMSLAGCGGGGGGSTTADGTTAVDGSQPSSASQTTTPSGAVMVTATTPQGIPLAEQIHFPANQNSCGLFGDTFACGNSVYLIDAWVEEDGDTLITWGDRTAGKNSASVFMGIHGANDTSLRSKVLMGDVADDQSGRVLRLGAKKLGLARGGSSATQSFVSMLNSSGVLVTSLPTTVNRVETSQTFSDAFGEVYSLDWSYSGASGLREDWGGGLYLKRYAAPGFSFAGLDRNSVVLSDYPTHMAGRAIYAARATQDATEGWSVYWGEIDLNTGGVVQGLGGKVSSSPVEFTGISPVDGGLVTCVANSDRPRELGESIRIRALNVDTVQASWLQFNGISGGCDLMVGGARMNREGAYVRNYSMVGNSSEIVVVWVERVGSVEGALSYRMKWRRKNRFNDTWADEQYLLPEQFSASFSFSGVSFSSALDSNMAIGVMGWRNVTQTGVGSYQMSGQTGYLLKYTGGKWISTTLDLAGKSSVNVETVRINRRGQAVAVLRSGLVSSKDSTEALSTVAF